MKKKIKRKIDIMSARRVMIETYVQASTQKFQDELSKMIKELYKVY